MTFHLIYDRIFHVVICMIKSYLFCLILVFGIIYLILSILGLNLFKIIKKFFFKHKFVVISLILLPLFSFFTVIAKTDNDIQNTNFDASLLSLNDLDSRIFDISLNKVIIVGDSRMEFIYNKKNKLNIPRNFIFDAKSGAKLDWLIDEGDPVLRDILDNRDSKYKYHVVFNLGVNDLNDDVSPAIMAEKYIEIYKEILLDYSDVKFYFLSVNPIDEKIIEKYFAGRRTNARIELFNSYIAKYVDDINDINIQYCDAYNRLNFNLPDGLHYDDETDQKILNFIARDCIDY